MKHLHTMYYFIVSLCLWFGTVPHSYATISDPLTTIDIETPVHFLAPDGSPLVTESSIFSVEAAEDWIRLVPDQRHNALLIEAKKGTHELELTDALALSVPDAEGTHSDLHHIVLLLPNGNSLEATGTYSGIRPRGLFDKVAKRIKKQTQQAYKNAHAKAKKTRTSGRVAAGKAKRYVEQQAKLSVLKITMVTMKKSIQKASQDKQFYLDKLKNANKKKQELLQKLKDKDVPRQVKNRLKHDLRHLDDTNKELNFELQKAAAHMNQVQKALSKIQRKYDDAQKAVINKM